MITYEIKTKATSILSHILPRWDRNTPALGHSLLSTWNKLEYTNWIEEVKKEWKVGDLICLRSNVEMANSCPLHYRIEGIQEIHYLAELATFYREPKAINCVIPDTVKHVSFCPKEIRKLTDKEVSLAHVRNKIRAISS